MESEFDVNEILMGELDDDETGAFETDGRDLVGDGDAGELFGEYEGDEDDAGEYESLGFAELGPDDEYSAFEEGDDEQESFEQLEGLDSESLEMLAESTLSASEEEALAYEYMSIQNEQELEEFLGKLFKKVKRAVGRIGRKVLPGVGKFLKGTGRKLLGKALPIVGSAVGSIIPGVGTAIGGAAGGVLGSLISGGGGRRRGRRGGRPGGLGSLAGLLGGGVNPLAALLGSGAGGNLLGSLLGGEMEGATLEEAKLDVAKRVVRTVAQAATQTAVDPRAAVDPDAAAKKALARAVRRNIPPALRPALADLVVAGSPAARRVGRVRRSGRWVRRDGRIVVMGA